MMREKTIEKIIREFIAKELTLSPDKIELEANLVNDLHADSMDIVNVVTAIESRFKIAFPDDSQIPYEGYTLKFLVEGVQKALRAKAPVRKAKAAGERVASRAKVKRVQVKEKVEGIEEKIEEKVEAKKESHKASRKAKKSASDEEPAPSDNL